MQVYPFVAIKCRGGHILTEPIQTDPNRPFGSVWIGFVSKKTGFGLLDCKPTSFGLDFGLEGFQTDSNRSNPEILYNYIIF